ncbi:hypothetical protein [Staphylococcus cohnii]|uniref:hypothetical protein n=1 Tax=Staphylococcus cohnii TaxID=29382 RepID=UPI0007D94B53|nr:hypothetical protein [Staphylococcus cohnii]OAO08710.1 hypothetical protein A4A82_10430 [Staphylococcus cohnii]
MRKATKQELEDFIRVNDFGVDGIYDKDSAIKHFRNASKQFKSELNQYKQAYQHCVDDLIVLRANNKRLERENEELKIENHRLDVLNYEQTLEQSNYSTLTSHIRTKAECNPGVSRYIDLVNFIDRLERD